MFKFSKKEKEYTLWDGIIDLRKELCKNGNTVKTLMWQGKKNPPEFIEMLHVNKIMSMGQNIEEAKKLCSPWLPWADDHFIERIGGIPLNPPPSHKYWLRGTEQYFTEDEQKFSHSYPERFWSKGLHEGIRYQIGDYNTLINVIKKDPQTRQAFLPIYFPEDLEASLAGERIPCTLGYQIIIRDNTLDIFYPMRSCDVLRHLHNDFYFANRLAIDIKDKTGIDCKIGKLHFVATSLHCFSSDMVALKQSINKMTKSGKIC